MKKPLVSVVVPAYNEEKNIGRFVESITMQTYRNVEVLVVDDESKDKTREVARDAGAKVYPRKHAERSAQRNFGAKKSKGEYLMILDADMELTPKVIEDCVITAKKGNYKLLVVPEKTVGEGFTQRVRRFEREMYMGDLSVEVARFFKRDVFMEFGGYDLKLTGPEDYDLPYRISKKYKVGRAKEYILHHEAGRGVWALVKRKYKYAKEGANYAEKHPELVATQGNLLFRKAYLRNWRKFVKEPVLGLSFIVIRILETLAAVLGYISAVGLKGFGKTFWKMIKK